MAEMERIVVGVDGSATSRQALAWALEQARLRSGVCVVVHAYLEHGSTANPFGEAHTRQTEDDARQVLADAARVAEASGVAFEAKLVVGHPAEVLLREAVGAELLVVGSRERGALASAVLGSVSSTCVHHATCPITLVPHGDPTIQGPGASD
jgi:nucleotide-binding universal stress UspA family protein